MKNRLIVAAIAILLVAGSTGAHAQLFKMGVKGGLLINTEKLKFDKGTVHFDGKDTRAGFEAGLQFSVNLPLVPLTIQPEIVYSRTSARYQTGDEHYGEIKMRSNMIDIPVLVGLKMGPARIMVGPVFTFPTTDLISMDNRSEKFAPRYNKFLMGLQAGVGVDIGRLTLDARYHWRFTSLTDDDYQIEALKNTKVSNGRFAISVGYTIFKIL